MAHYDLTPPISEAQARALRVDDTVTLHGTLFGIRDATQIHMFDRGRRTRFDMAGHAVIHTAPTCARWSVEPRIPQDMHLFASAPPPATGWSGSRGR